MNLKDCKKPDKCLLVLDLGLMPFDQVLDVQMAAVDEVANGGQERIFLVEHPPVITLGRNSGREHLLVAPENLKQQGISLVQTSRGGSITCHYPGQLVTYPVLRMARRPGGLRVLVRDMEEAALRSLAWFGLHGQRLPGRPGVWIGKRKIASIGLGLRKWVSYHGMALNLCRDTSLFDLITLCGLSGVRPASVHGELQQERPNMEEMKEILARALRDVLSACVAW
ncbi:MAG TPA: lipoyl(octanoyl) transferase [Desulfonatronum sp.]|nr:lipoyl(octanoyl) transferase [Desulfonatronum sp.]